MTECDNADVRDVLPDYVAETLSASELPRVTTHLAECAPCRDEVALLRVARASRPQAVHLDIDAIVAKIGKPGQPRVPGIDVAEVTRAAMTVASAETHRSPAAQSPDVISLDARRAPVRRSRVWQMAAAIGIVAIGGWSVYTAQGRGGLMNGARSDSARLGDVAERTTSPVDGAAGIGDSGKADALVADAGSVGDSTRPARDESLVPAGRSGVVSVGDLSDYTDAELQRMLDRLDKWDGATSSEVMPTMPIVPVGSTGSE